MVKLFLAEDFQWKQVELSKNYEVFEDDRDAEMEISLTAAALIREAPNAFKQYVKNSRRVRSTKYDPPYRPPPKSASRYGEEGAWTRVSLNLDYIQSRSYD